MSQAWYCRFSGEEYGPISLSELQRWVEQQRVSRDDCVRQEEGEWLVARDVPGLQWPPESMPTPPPLPSARDVMIRTSPPGRGEAPGRRGCRTSTFKDRFLNAGRTPTSWVALLDWRFEYYLTPWIIRLLWICLLIGVAGSIVLGAVGVVSEMLPDLSVPQAHTPRLNSEGYADPQGSPTADWLTLETVRLIAYFVFVIGSILGVLVLRMLLELLIVVFRIAEDIGFLRRASMEEG